MRNCQINERENNEYPSSMCHSANEQREKKKKYYKRCAVKSGMRNIVKYYVMEM